MGFKNIIKILNTVKKHQQSKQTFQIITTFLNLVYFKNINYYNLIIITEANLYEFISVDHCHLFPRPLGELIDRFSIQELHISLTEGLWRHEGWGYPVIDAPPGAELWVWFKPGTVK